MFEDLGLKYIGPVDGHDIEALEHSLRRARAFSGPVIVHVITEKGRGYLPAERDDSERFHAVGVIDIETGQPLAKSGTSWTSIFSDELIDIARGREDVVAITAAMMGPVGLTRFAKEFPRRTYDVGIAEQHAVTSAAGMAFAGLHPVVAVYSTFINRAFDQVLMDCALHKAGVTFVLDRSGVTGDDGATHNGMWDLSILPIVPGIRIAAPRDAGTLRAALREAVSIDDGPTVIRFAKGAVNEEMAPVRRSGSVDILHEDPQASVLLVSVGVFAPLCLDVAARLADQGIGVTVVDPRWVIPVSDDLVKLGAKHDLVVTVEDNLRSGGIGSAVSAALRSHEIDVPCRDIGIEPRFLEQGNRAAVLASLGLTAQDISRQIVETVARFENSVNGAGPVETESRATTQDSSAETD